MRTGGTRILGTPQYVFYCILIIQIYLPLALVLLVNFGMMRGTAWVSWSKWNCGRDMSWPFHGIYLVKCRRYHVGTMSRWMTLQSFNGWKKSMSHSQNGCLKRIKKVDAPAMKGYENSRDMLRHVRQCCDISEQSFVVLRDIGWYFQCGAWTDRYHRWLQNRHLFAIACGIVHAVRCIKASLCSSLAQPGDRSWVHGVKHTHNMAVLKLHTTYIHWCMEKNSWW